MKNKILQNNIILYIVMLGYIIIGIITYKGIISLFPVIIGILYSMLLWQNNVKKIRIGTSVMILSWLIYNISVSAYMAALVEVVLLISSIGAIIKIDILKKQ